MSPRPPSDPGTHSLNPPFHRLPAASVGASLEQSLRMLRTVVAGDQFDRLPEKRAEIEAMVDDAWRELGELRDQVGRRSEAHAAAYAAMHADLEKRDRT